MRQEMTAAALDRAKPGDELWDDKVKGLHARVTAGGARFFLYYRVAGRERRPKIGEYGILTLDAARRIAREHLAKVYGGEDPQAAKEARAKAPTLDAMAADYFTRAMKTGAWRKRMYERLVAPKLGRRKLAEVTFDDCVALHQRLTADGPIQANRALELLRAIYAYAIRRRVLKENPVAGLEWNVERSRKRHAKAAELPRIAAYLNAKAAEQPAAVAYLWTMLYSGARPQEVLNARPDQLEVLDSGVGRLVLEVHKGDDSGEDRIIYLPPQAVRLIQQLPAKRATLTGLRSPPKTLWYAMRKDLGIPDLWIRDLRRSFASIALAGGQSLSLIGELLGHADPKTTKVYARLMDDHAQKAVVETAALIDKLTSA